MKRELPIIVDPIKFPRKFKKKAKLLITKQQEKSTGYKVKIKLVNANFQTNTFEYLQRTYLNKKL